jgi:hypothetical protein
VPVYSDPEVRTDDVPFLSSQEGWWLVELVQGSMATKTETVCLKLSSEADYRY